MAFSGIVALSLAAFFIFSLVNGQSNLNNPIRGCNSADIASGKYSSPHPNYCELSLRCDSGLNQHVIICPKGLLFDSRNSICNWPVQTVCESWTCNSNTVGTKYPGTCCDTYYECNGSGYTAMTCPTGLTFIAQRGECQAGNPCVDQKECIRYGTTQTDPTRNCTMVADPSGNVCMFRMRDGARMTEPMQCAEGTAFNANACTCTESAQCMRSTNSSLNKVQDPQCRASFRLQFSSTTRAIAISDKIAATPTTLNDFVELRGVQVGNGVATFSSNTITGAQPSIYLYSFAANQLSPDVVFSFLYKPTRAHSFQLLGNNQENACTPTIEANVTFTGTSHQITLTVTLMTQTTVTTQVTNTATLTININAGTNDFVDLIIVIARTVSAQAINRGPTGQANLQVVNSATSGVLGDSLAYNKCGMRVGHGFNGDLQQFIVREACADVTRVRVN